MGTHDNRLNILVLCTDLWQTYLDLPEEVGISARERLEVKALGSTGRTAGWGQWVHSSTSHGC